MRRASNIEHFCSLKAALLCGRAFERDLNSFGSSRALAPPGGKLFAGRLRICALTVRLARLRWEILRNGLRARRPRNEGAGDHAECGAEDHWHDSHEPVPEAYVAARVEEEHF